MTETDDNGTAPPLIEARGVSKAYPGVIALDKVSMHLHPGEILAIIGENGAGKSTLMKTLAGIVQPDAGQVSEADGFARGRHGGAGRVVETSCQQAVAYFKPLSRIRQGRKRVSMDGEGRRSDTFRHEHRDLRQASCRRGCGGSG